MLKTSYPLKNSERIFSLLKEFVEQAFESLKEDPLLLCTECSDVDIFIASAYQEEFEEAIKVNFEVDEFGEIIDRKAYHDLMYELQDEFLKIHIESGLFDYFPEGAYEVNGEYRMLETDVLAPKGFYFAPFDDAFNKQ